jgi:hypothetical protein
MSKNELNGRSRDQDGQIRRKRSDTELSSLRKTYGPDFGSDFRSDMKLGTLLERTHSESLDEYLKKHRCI